MSDVVSSLFTCAAGPAPRRLSDVLTELTVMADPRLSIAEMIKVMGDRSFAPIMVLLAVPNLFFFLPGSSIITGLPLICISVQLLIGVPVLWLPRRIGERSVDHAGLARVVGLAIPYVRRIEGLARPRYWPASRVAAERITGAACLVMAIFMFLPIPFANGVPAMSVIMLALGLGERDGIWTAVGLVFAFISTLIVAAIVSVGFAAVFSLLA